MNPIRKQFRQADPAFPFAFVYKDTKTSQSELPDHLHDWYELVYVYRGKGTFFIDQTFYDMQQGDLFAIPGNTIHRAFPDKEDPVTSTAVFFSPLLVQQATFGDSFAYMSGFEQSKKRKMYKLELPVEQQQAIDACLDRIRQELDARQPGYRHAVVLELQRILLLQNRRIDPAERKPANRSDFGPRWMTEILQYMEDHLCDDIGLTALAQRASVTPAHFSRVFKQRIGMNVTEYMMTKRIVRAKDLLLETDGKINEIAETCGFESLPHFHRMFKRVLGVTPAAYRKSAK